MELALALALNVTCSVTHKHLDLFVLRSDFQPKGTAKNEVWNPGLSELFWSNAKPRPQKTHTKKKKKGHSFAPNWSVGTQTGEECGRIPRCFHSLNQHTTKTTNTVQQQNHQPIGRSTVFTTCTVVVNTGCRSQPAFFQATH